MPGASYYYWIARDTSSYKYLGVTYFHHSNGQDGPQLLPNGEVNLRTGDFATDFIEISYHRGSINTTSNSYNKLGLELHWGLAQPGNRLGYDQYFGFARVNFRFAEVINRFRKRTPGVGSTRAFEERLRTAIEGTLVIDNIKTEGDFLEQSSKRLNIELFIYYKIKDSPNTALFISAGWLGHDYYNIYFIESKPMFRFGVAASTAFFYQK